MKKLFMLMMTVLMSLAVISAGAVDARAVTVAPSQEFQARVTHYMDSEAPVPASNPQLVAELERAGKEMNAGEQRAINVEGGAIINLRKTDTGMAISIQLPAIDTNGLTLQASPCAWAVASAIVGIGAAAFGVMAALSGGSGVVIAGVLISKSVLEAIAAGTFGFSSILALVSLYVC